MDFEYKYRLLRPGLDMFEMIKRVWRNDKTSDSRFWEKIREKYGIIRDEKGLIKIEKRENKGLEGEIRGEKGESG